MLLPDRVAWGVNRRSSSCGIDVQTIFKQYRSGSHPNLHERRTPIAVQVINRVLEGGGPRVWAILSCVNRHWKNVAEEFAACKMAAEPRMDRIPLQYRSDLSTAVRAHDFPQF